MHAPPPRLLSTKVPLVVGGLTVLLWVGGMGAFMALPFLVAARSPMIVAGEPGSEAAGPAGPAGRRGGPRDVVAAVAGDPTDVAERLRAAGFVDDPGLSGRRRSRPFGAWMAALRYDDDASACTVLLEGTTSRAVELVEIEATFPGRAGPAEVARVIGPTLSVLDPGAEPTMMIAAMHDGAGRVGPWRAERYPVEGGGMAVVLVNGSMPVGSGD